MGEGVSEEYYTTYLHYMNADEFIQYFMDYAHPGSTLTKSLEFVGNSTSDIPAGFTQLQKSY